MSETKIVVSFPHVSGLPKDVSTNTFTVSHSLPPTGADRTFLFQTFRDLYNADSGAGQVAALGTYLSPELTRAANAASVKQYDITGHLDGSPHGSPVQIDTFTLVASGGSAFPSEVAMCVTLEASGRAAQQAETADGADPGTALDRPRQRYTGRVYLGPLTSDTDAVDANNAMRPTATFRADILERFKQTQIALLDYIPNDFVMCVWSRSDEILRPVGSIAVDDAFDTQRRRGVAPLTRSRVNVP